MPSSLTWLDHDGAAHDRSLRILALFREKDSRDELGLGSIRDSFADALFPGTSTIMTRRRYMLFVPWIYTHLEGRQVPAREFGHRARQLELALVTPLLGNEDAGGVFGKNAKGDLQRLPSSVYWAVRLRTGRSSTSGTRLISTRLPVAAANFWIVVRDG